MSEVNNQYLPLIHDKHQHWDQNMNCGWLNASVLEIKFYSIDLKPSTVHWHDNMDFHLELGKIQICDEFNT